MLAAAGCAGGVSADAGASAVCPAGGCASEGSGAAANEPADSSSAAGTSADPPASLVACNPLSDWLRDGGSAPARVEAHARTPDGEEIVLIGPEPRSAGAVRGFIGRDGRLKELFVPTLVEPELEWAHWTFSVGAGEGAADYRIYATYAQDNERVANVPRGSKVVVGVDAPLEELSRTRLALAGLEFECSPSGDAAWRLSNVPSRHDPPSSCVQPAQHAFHCLDLPQETLVRVDPNDGVWVGRLRASALAVGSGRPPGGACLDEVSARLEYSPSTELEWARFEWEGREGWMVMSSPGVGLPFEVGGALDIDYRGYLRYEETLQVRDGSGRLLLWMATAADTQYLATPAELSIATGPEQCANVPSGCTLASQYAIDFTLNGLTEEVAYGKSREADGYVLVHGGYDVGILAVDGCDDGAAPGVTAQVWAVR